MHLFHPSGLGRMQEDLLKPFDQHFHVVGRVTPAR